MTDPSDKVAPAEAEDAQYEHPANITEHYEASIRAWEGVAGVVYSVHGDDTLKEYIDASINARPGKVWSETMVLARVMANALAGELSPKSFEEMMIDARIALSVYDTYLLVADSEFVQKPFEDAWRQRLSSVFDYQDTHNDDSVPFDDYQVELLQRCQTVVDLLSAKSISTEEAKEVQQEFEKQQEAYRNKPLPGVQYDAYELLHRRVLDKILAEDPEGAISTATYLVKGLDEDALPAVKLFLNDFLVRQRLGNHIRAFIGEEDFRDGKLAAWKTLNKIAPTIIKEAADESDAFDNAQEVQTIDLETFKPLQVDWEVLPAGQLQDAAREIAQESKDAGHEVVIDPERLKALETIRTQWGADKSYYAKGALKTRNVQRNTDKQCPDQYILLVMQDTDAEGNMIEHVVAESPIAGPHAMYVYRQDVNPDAHWRTVMSVEKRDARKMGARPVKHPTLDNPSDLPDVMADRVATLLSATRDEFMKLEFRKNGFTIRNTLAIKAFAAIERDIT